MNIISDTSYDDLLKQSLGKYRISCYSTSGGRADAIYGDVSGRCYPYDDKAVLTLSRHLKAENPVYVKVTDGSGWLVADKFYAIQNQLEEGIKELGEPNGSGIGYEFYSVFVNSPLFWNGTPIVAYPKQDFRRFSEDTYWDVIEFICNH